MYLRLLYVCLYSDRQVHYGVLFLLSCKLTSYIFHLHYEYVVDDGQQFLVHINFDYELSGS